MSTQDEKISRGTAILIGLVIALIIVASLKLVQSVGKKFTPQTDITKIKE
ncbi:hypothetical protein GW889_02215 [Candidatus Berkelbacteria bacterium]|nr:hypothetical protein [Candidatus Berkelbacteria bacterium]